MPVLFDSSAPIAQPQPSEISADALQLAEICFIRFQISPADVQADHEKWRAVVVLKVVARVVRDPPDEPRIGRIGDIKLHDIRLPRIIPGFRDDAHRPRPGAEGQNRTAQCASPAGVIRSRRPSG